MAAKNTIVLFDQDSQTKVMKGVETLTKAVGQTLGPRGRNIGIDREYEHLVIHDGVKVARSIVLEDPTENLGVKIIREAAEKQVNEVGDGTTVVTILAEAIVKESLKRISNGVSPMALRGELEEARDIVCANIKKLAKPITTLEEKINVATISAEEEELGELVGKVIDNIGADGVVTIEESRGAETIVDHQEGMQFDRGFLSPYFVTDADRGEATVENALVLITDKPLNNIMSLKKLLEEMQMGNHTSLAVIAPEVGGSALPSFVATKINGGANILCVKAPMYGHIQKDFMQDLAILMGGKVITEDAGMKFEDVGISDLGQVTRMTATKNTTVIIGGKGDKKLIEDRVKSIEAQMEAEESDYEKEKFRERMAKLSRGVVVIKVGGHTEVEMKERKERADDAVHATQAAVKGGIVPGGEIVYELATEGLLRNNYGHSVMLDALRAPFTKLLANAGLDAGEYRSKLYVTNKQENIGVDVVTNQIINMLEAGIIDPADVSLNAVKNAVSVAIQLISMGGTIVNTPDVPGLPKK